MDILGLEALKKYFGSGLLRHRLIKAVDGVDLHVKRGEIHALIGESGSGKTTLARMILGLIKPTEGRIWFDEIDVTSMKGNSLRMIRINVQAIFQNPYDSLNPRMKVKDIIVEPAVAQGFAKSQSERTALAIKMLEDVKMTPTQRFLKTYPGSLSGGQRQRIALARALSIGSRLILADEPVSMLDVSLRAEVFNLMLDLRSKGTSFLLIGHDIAAARHVADTGSIMYRGKIVETGTMLNLVRDPSHEYTRQLISAVPRFPVRTGGLGPRRSVHQL